jgi:hypothetical protein
VENEYGSYGLQTGHCDKRYLTRMRDLLRQLIGTKPVLFTTDGNSDDLGIGWAARHFFKNKFFTFFVKTVLRSHIIVTRLRLRAKYFMRLLLFIKVTFF